LKAFATVDPNNLSDKDKGYNLVKGNWTTTKEYKDLLDPMTGQVIMKYPSTSLDEIEPFVESL
jgi:1-pyrroline-5-carboxylate dehydrogenase